MFRHRILLVLAGLTLSAALALAEPRFVLEYPGGVPQVSITGSYPGSTYAVWRAPVAGGEPALITDQSVLCLGSCYAEDRSSVPGTSYLYRFDVTMPTATGATTVSFGPYQATISPALARETYVDSLVWVFGQIAQGMYTASGGRKAYPQLSAIHLGFLMTEGAVTFDPAATAANGVDKGVFIIHLDKMPAAADKLMKAVATIKATGDKAAAEALAKKDVDDNPAVIKLVTDRVLRFPKTSFVYALDL